MQPRASGAGVGRQVHRKCKGTLLRTAEGIPTNRSKYACHQCGLAQYIALHIQPLVAPLRTALHGLIFQPMQCAALVYMEWG